MSYRCPACRWLVTSRPCGPLAFDAELDPHVGQVLADLVVLDAAGRLEHIHRFDTAERLRSLGQGFLGRMAPTLGRDAYQIDGLHDCHGLPPWSPSHSNDRLKGAGAGGEAAAPAVAWGCPRKVRTPGWDRT